MNKTESNGNLLGRACKKAFRIIISPLTAIAYWRRNDALHKAELERVDRIRHPLKYLLMD
jgi:hypothetical protein